MDRVSPTIRPRARVVGTQSWRKLLFLHWSFPPDVIRPLVPRSVELDLWEGRALVGVVPFAMRNIRPWWLPRVAAMDFLETNVRTYVHHRGGNPGVFFFSLEASSWLAVQAARRGFGLPYFHANMTLEVRPDGSIRYETVRRGTLDAVHRVTYVPGEHLGASPVGTLEHFLLERYLLYVERSGALFRGQVHHAPYPAQRATVVEVRDGLMRAAGLPVVTGMPEYAHYAEGVDVEIFPLVRV
ncbi:MAG: DUF2071 domain-containing protein [Myxococcota bacterium]